MHNNPFNFVVVILLTLTVSVASFAQQNFVPNGSFESINDCDLNYGEIEKAPPWKIIQTNIINTPDLFHFCTTSGFYLPVVNSGELAPTDGEAMMGQVHFRYDSESVYARLTQALPTGVDIYVSCSILPRETYNSETEIICYSNTQSLAFARFDLQELVVALDTDTIQSNVAAWTTLGTCYRATGEEDLIVIGNQKLLSEVEFDCFNESENNFSYTHFDDIIVAPFDLVPDTLNLCEGTPIEWDASFYDLPIRWSDGWTGPQREFTAGGWYQIFGDTGDCELRDDVFVVEIPEIYPVFEQILCSNSTVELVVPYPPAVWSTGEEASSLIVNQPGTYTADFETPCGTRQQTFTVTEQRCELTYYVPNVFSPNRDGVNDKLEFFFRANGDFQGELHLFDRWGNLVYQKAVNSTDPPPSWDGRFRNRELPAGVYLWFFRYEIGINETSNIITGDATLIR